MRVSVCVPTTDYLSMVAGITRRTVLPRSVVLTPDDYRPISGISERYHDFAGPTGPIRGMYGTGLSGSFELMLTNPPETGRSWELPVALAHRVHAKGGELVSQAPDLVVWATGALQNDGSVASQNYHLNLKLPQSLKALTALGVSEDQVLFLVPVSASVETILADHGWSGARVTPVPSLGEAMQALDAQLAEGATRVSAQIARQAAAVSPCRARLGKIAAAAFVGAALVASVGFLALQGQADTGDDTVTPTVALSPPKEGVSSQERPFAVLAANAPEGATCLDVVFGDVAPVRTPIIAKDDVFEIMAVDGLCQIVIQVPAGSDDLPFTFGPRAGDVFVAADLHVFGVLGSGQEDSLTLRAHPAPTSVALSVADGNRQLSYELRIGMIGSGEDGEQLEGRQGGND